MTGITEQLARLRQRVHKAAEAAGRDPGGIRILAVSKGQPPERVAAARAAGLTEFGENYLQEALPKIAAIGEGPAWHFIGGIQSNKTGPIALHFDAVQSVCDPRIAERLARQRPALGPPLDVCLQLRPAGGADRPGVDEARLDTLADLVASLGRLRLRGLMIVPLGGLDEPALRAEFARAAALYRGLVARGHSLDTLSMGMSADLEAAIAEGSTMIRIGTALFGPRGSR